MDAVGTGAGFFADVPASASDVLAIDTGDLDELHTRLGCDVTSGDEHKHRQTRTTCTASTSLTHTLPNHHLLYPLHLPLIVQAS